MKNGYFGAIIFHEIEFFEHYMTPKNFNFQKTFTAKITLTLFWMLKSKVLMTYFMFVLLRATGGGDKKYKIKVVPSTFMKF